MNNIFHAYSVSHKNFVDFIVESKIKTKVRGHFTYILKGKTFNHKSITSLVNKEQWQQFDVPIEERNINKKIDRKKIRNKLLKPCKKVKKPRKFQTKIYNEQIEKWLIDNYNIDLNKI